MYEYIDYAVPQIGIANRATSNVWAMMLAYMNKYGVGNIHGFFSMEHKKFFLYLLSVLLWLLEPKSAGHSKRLPGKKTGTC